MSLTLWGRPSSVNVQKVLWALEEFGFDHDHRIVGGRYGGLEAPEFRALTPAGKVPVLKDGDLAVWESHAILRHLARRAPDDPMARSLSSADPWLEWGSTTFQPPFIGLFWQKVRMTPAERSEAAQASHRAALAQGLDLLETAMAAGRPGIGGADLTLADIGVGSLMFRLFDVAPDLAEGRAAVADWVARLSARPGWQRHVATSYEELRAPEA